MGSGPKLLERLLSNNSKQALETVENFYYDEKLTKLLPLLKRFIKSASNLEHAFVGLSQAPPLKAFFGSSTMIICPIHNEGGIRFELPKLKHLAWFNYSSSLYPQEFDFINRLAPQLDSFMALLITKPGLPPSIYSLPSSSVLFEFFPLQGTEPTLAGVRNLYIPLNGEFQNTNRGIRENFEKELSGLDKWIGLIGTPGHQLETLTLASLRESSPSNEALARVATLIKVCEENGIEVIWDERGDQATFYDLVPASFIRRVEALP
ncbi:uncharacterized protein JCM6883_003888 [Sporobolomyces salmoneus]|uniref:uncharacterized protein n=1 Tax=Sporobolomyces salmoneus TaxID=183962 RepID=UPI0031719919